MKDSSRSSLVGHANLIKMFDVRVSQKELSLVLGCSSDLVKLMVNRGALEMGDDRRYHLGDSIKRFVGYYLDYSRKNQITRKDSAGQRERLTAAQADMAEMTRGIMAGNLVQIDWVEENYGKLSSLFSNRIMAFPDVITPKLVKYIKDGKRFEEVRSTIRDVCHETAEEICTLEIDYEVRPLKYRARGRTTVPEEDDVDGEASTESFSE